MTAPQDEFQQALDDCLDRYMRGEPMEECLRAHPAYAHQLERALQVAAKFQSLWDYRPSLGAKEEGRRRLMAERQSILRQRQDESNRKHRGVVQPVFIAAASVVLAVGVASVSVGTGALGWHLRTDVSPAGQLLQSQTPAGWANTYLRNAEAQAEEAVQLMSAGQPTEAVQAVQDLAQQVTATLGSIDSLANSPQAAQVYTQLQESSSDVLDRLQASAASAPVASRTAAATALRVAGAAYSQAIESAAGVARAAPPQGQGTITLTFLDGLPSSADVGTIWLRVSDVGSLIAGPGGGWRTVSSEPFTVSVPSAGSSPPIIDATLHSGQYTRLRLNVSLVTVQVGGMEQPANFPSAIEIDRPFTIDDGQSTTLSVDLSGLRVGHEADGSLALRTNDVVLLEGSGSADGGSPTTSTNGDASHSNIEQISGHGKAPTSERAPDTEGGAKAASTTTSVGWPEQAAHTVASSADSAPHRKPETTLPSHNGQEPAPRRESRSAALILTKPTAGVRLFSVHEH